MNMDTSNCGCSTRDPSEEAIPELPITLDLTTLGSIPVPNDTPALEEAAQKLKVCGHPVRLRLLRAIARGEDACVSQLWVCLNQPQPVVSQHLAVLKDKGIVKSEVQGNRRIYSIIDPFIKALVMALDTSDTPA